jgi:hypothetical protein
MQKSLSAATITKKQGEKISSGVIDSSKYEPAREKEEGESLSAVTIYEKDMWNRKNEFFGIQNDESISPEMSVSTKLSASPDSINSNSNFSNANLVIIEKEVEQQQPSNHPLSPIKRMMGKGILGTIRAISRITITIIIHTLVVLVLVSCKTQR